MWQQLQVSDLEDLTGCDFIQKEELSEELQALLHRRDEVGNREIAKLDRQIGLSERKNGSRTRSGALPPRGMWAKLRRECLRSSRGSFPQPPPFPKSCGKDEREMNHRDAGPPQMRVFCPKTSRDRGVWGSKNIPVPHFFLSVVVWVLGDHMAQRYGTP